MEDQPKGTPTVETTTWPDTSGDDSSDWTSCEMYGHTFNDDGYCCDCGAESDH